MTGFPFVFMQKPILIGVMLTIKDFRYNSLVNSFLYTGGFGIDVVTFYDLVFRFEYSFNQLGQSGLFFHIGSDF